MTLSIWTALCTRRCSFSHHLEGFQHSHNNICCKNSHLLFTTTITTFSTTYYLDTVMYTWVFFSLIILKDSSIATRTYAVRSLIFSSLLPLLPSLLPTILTALCTHRCSFSHHLEGFQHSHKNVCCKNSHLLFTTTITTFITTYYLDSIMYSQVFFLSSS